jgi:HEAT repeat protein
MTRRTKVITVAAFAGLVALCIFLAYDKGGEGPIYHGKPLSHWVDIYGAPGNGPRDPEAEDAIKSAGTNAFPYLIKWTQWNRVPLGARLPKPVAKLIYNQNPEVLISRRERRIIGAQLAFQPLRKLATPAAMEELAKLMNTAASNPAASEIATRAFTILASLRPRGLVPLIPVIENPKHPLRRDAVESINVSVKNDLNAEMFAPGLIRCLDDTDYSIRTIAADALGDFQAAPPVVVPILIAHLETTDFKLKMAIVRALGDFQSESAHSLPILSNLLSDPSIANDACMAIARLTANTPATTP